MLGPKARIGLSPSRNTRKAAVARGATRDELPEVGRAPTTQDLGRSHVLGLAFGCTQRQQPQELNLTRVYFTLNSTASRWGPLLCRASTEPPSPTCLWSFCSATFAFMSLVAWWLRNDCCLLPSVWVQDGINKEVNRRKGSPHNPKCKISPDNP